MRRRLIWIALAMGLFQPAAGAALLAYDGFVAGTDNALGEYIANPGTDTSGRHLLMSGQDPALAGFSGSWSHNGGAWYELGTSPIASLSYSDGLRSLATSGNAAFRRWLNGESTRALDNAVLGLGADGNTRYISFLMQLDDPTHEGDIDFCESPFFNAGILAVRAGGSRFYARVAFENHDLAAADNQAHFFVWKITFGASDEWELFMDPVLSAEGINTPVASGSSAGIDPTHINLARGSVGGTVGNGVMFDEIRIGDTWEAVVGELESISVSSYEDWTLFHQLSGTNADYAANPDGDSLNNMYEWGLGGDPTNALDQGISPAHGITTEGGTNWFTYVYPSNVLASDLLYYLETDTDLANPPGWTNDHYEVAGISDMVDSFAYVTNVVSTEIEDHQFVRLKLEAKPGADELFVAPWGDDDANPGTLALPKRTMQGAMDRVDQIKSSTGLPPGGLTVNFRGGKYFDDVMEVFYAGDSGAPGKPVIYQSYPGETARFVGGIELDTAGFTTVTSSDAVWSRLDDAAKGNLLKLDLSPYGLTDYGSPTSYPKEISFNKEIMQLGRWPNDVGDFSSMVTTVAPVSDTTFTYTGTRPERWATAPDPWVKGNLSNGYFENIIAIAGINTSTKRITLAENPLDRGVDANHGWHAFNLLEEIDLPGEYYIDRTNDVLYFWPPSDISSAEVLLSAFGDGGTRMFDINGASHVTFKDLVFEMSPARFCQVLSSDSIVFDGCTFRNGGDSGMTFTQTSNLTVKNCRFYGLGNSGMAFFGCGDRATLTPANNLIVNNYFSGTGRWKNGFGYRPPLTLYSSNTGFTIRNNHIEDTRAIGMLIGGNLHTVSYNRFHRVCQASDDMGAIYGGGGWAGGQGNVFLHNEFYDVRNTMLPGDYGNHGTCTIYNDINGSGSLIEGNISYPMGTSRIYLNNNGRDNVYKNNVNAHGGSVYYGADWPSGSGCSYLDTLLSYDYNVPGSAWYETFPHLLEIPDDCNDPSFSNYDHPLHCRVESSIDWLCGSFTSGTGIPYYTIVPGSLSNTDPKFLDETNLVFALADDSPAYTIPGFERIPWERIGLLGEAQATRGIPLDGSIGHGATLDLYWAPALEAASHKVYLGTNPADVTARHASTYLGEVSDANMTGVALSTGTTYYWAVDEFDSGSQPMGAGDVWSFTTE